MSKRLNSFDTVLKRHGNQCVYVYKFPCNIFHNSFLCFPPQITFQLQPARVYLEDTFVYYIKTLFHTYIPDSAMASATAETQRSRESGSGPTLPEQVNYSLRNVFIKALMRLNVFWFSHCILIQFISPVVQSS